MFRNYLEVIKPGIIIGNVILIIGSFLCAVKHSTFDIFLFLYTILGSVFIIASACILNNFIDRDIDKKMYRTCNRVLARRLISSFYILILSIFLGILGFFILGILVNFISMSVAIFGFFVYVVLYTLLYKRRSIYSTLIGSFSGSTPSLIGYTAVSNKIDFCSILLFMIFIFWQMSHFYAISIFRIKDYKNAKIPVFPIVKGILKTKQHIFFYILFFIFFSTLLTFFGYLSYIFLFFSFFANIYWLFLAYINIKRDNYIYYSKKLFYYSIFIVILFNFLMSIDFLF